METKSSPKHKQSMGTQWPIDYRLPHQPVAPPAADTAAPATPQRQSKPKPTSPPCNNEEQNTFSSVSIRMTAILQGILGCASIMLGVIAILLECYLSNYSVPVWAGLLLYITTGALGIRAYYKNMTKGMTITYMAMCICSAVGSAAIFVMYINVAIEESYSYPCFSFEFCRTIRVRTIVNIIIALVCFCELAVSVTGASLTCCRVCQCCLVTPSNVNMIYYNQPGGMPGQTVPQFVSGQPVMVQASNVQSTFQQPPPSSPTSPRPDDAAQMTGVVVTGTSPVHASMTTTFTTSEIGGRTSPDREKETEVEKDPL